MDWTRPTSLVESYPVLMRQLFAFLFALKHYHFPLVKALMQNVSLILQLVFDQDCCNFLVLMHVCKVSFMAHFANGLLLPSESANCFQLFIIREFYSILSVLIFHYHFEVEIIIPSFRCHLQSAWICTSQRLYLPHAHICVTFHIRIRIF